MSRRTEMYQEENEVSINLADMFAHILHHWKMVILFMIGFAVVVGGIMSYREYRANKSRFDETTYASMVKDLTDAQIENVDQFYNRYIAFKDRVSDSQYYIDNSLMMKLDANNMSIYTKEYLIKTPYSGIMSSFCNASLDMDDYKAIAAVIGDDIDPRFVNELFTLDGYLGQDAYDIDTDKVGDVVNGSIENTYTGILHLTVKANDKDTCEQIKDLVDAAISEHLNNLVEAGIKVEMSELTTVYTEKMDTALAAQQRAKIEEGSNLITDYHKFEDTAKSSMDEDEQKLFQYRIDKVQNVKESVSYKKWIVIGLAVGLVLALVILVIGYLLIPGIKTAEEAMMITKEKEMGIIIQPAKARLFLGKLFHNWAKSVEFHGVNQIPDTESIPLMCDRIERICKDKEAKSVFLVYDAKGGYSQEVTEKCVKLLEESGLKAKYGNPGASMEALKGLRESEAAVLVLTNKESLPDSIRGNKVVCEENSVPIIGNFIIHPQR